MGCGATQFFEDHAMRGFGVHTSMWTSGWTPAGAEHTIEAVKKYNLDFIEISIADLDTVDAAHTRRLLAANHMQAVCSLGLPERAWASKYPDAAIEFLTA